ncbi:MAG: proline--tRNA ligase, partial [Pseudomonadota bacterium]|nr:proline--tRNA ligase [Pseudomonadota bacterium]
AEALPPVDPRPAPAASLARVATPGQYTIAAVSQFLSVAPQQTVKTLLVQGIDGVVALCLRGDHELNTLKAEKHPLIAVPFAFASDEQIRAAAGCNAGSLGPVGLAVPVIADRAAASLADFVCGANADDQHLTGVNWGRDLPEPEVADLRNVVAGDPSPDGNGTLTLVRGIEVGHIFQLGDKYSAALNATVLDEQGRSRTMLMGCYGIGVSRLVAAAIEQNHDAQGICWPPAMAPFQVALLPINAHKSRRLREAAEALYQELLAAGFEVLLDDRDVRPGVMFADMELIGIPQRLVLGERALDAGEVEYRHRRDADSQRIDRRQLLALLRSRLEG